MTFRVLVITCRVSVITLRVLAITPVRFVIGDMVIHPVGQVVPHH